MDGSQIVPTKGIIKEFKAQNKFSIASIVLSIVAILVALLK
jgi:hypothetical protein